MPRLVILIDNNSVTQIQNAGEQVVITKQVGGVNSTIAWLAFTPWSRMVVNWADDYSAYASTSQVQQGAVIVVTSPFIFPSPGKAYSFAQQFFNPSTPKDLLGPGTYELINNDNMGALTFGLALKAEIDTGSVDVTPICAQSVLQGQWLDMTPNEVIQVYLQANVSNGMVVGTVPGNACTVSFGGDYIYQIITYNPATGGFELTSTQA